MEYSEIRVAVPHEIYNDIKLILSEKQISLNCLIVEAIADKLRKIKEEAFVRQVNEAFDDPDVAEEQRLMAESVANSMNIEELPW